MGISPQKNLAIHQLGEWVNLRTGLEFLSENCNLSRPLRLWSLRLSSPWLSLCTDYDMPAGKGVDKKIVKFNIMCLLHIPGNLSLLGPNSLPDIRHYVQRRRRPCCVLLERQLKFSVEQKRKNKINNRVIFLEKLCEMTKKFSNFVERQHIKTT